MSEVQDLKEKKILIVEDDETLGRTLKERLANDYQVEWASSLKEVQNQLSKTFDLLILDVGLPDGSGFDVAKLIKNTPIVFLTAQADAESRLQGYELGAMEYIPKPFHLKELLMRVQHVLAEHVSEKLVELKKCVVNLSSFSVTKKNGTIEYPPITEMKVLKFLIENSPKPLSRDEIIDAVWGVDKNPSHRSIDNVIVRLRDILGEEDGKNIRSVRGHGYQWIIEL